MAESQKEKLMRVLGCTEAEAVDIIETDKIIDKGGRTPYDLTPEQEKEAKAFARTRTVYNFDTSNRQRKENPTKASIIQELAEFLQNQSENAVVDLEITNKERQIAFSIGSNRFELTLVQKRAQKK